MLTCSCCKRNTNSVWGSFNCEHYRCWDCYATWDGSRWVYWYEHNTDRRGES